MRRGRPIGEVAKKSHIPEKVAVTEAAEISETAQIADFAVFAIFAEITEIVEVVEITAIADFSEISGDAEIVQTAEVWAKLLRLPSLSR